MAAPRRLFPERGFGRSDGPKSLFQPAESKAVAVQLPQPLFFLDGNPLRADLLLDSETISTAHAYRVSALVYACMTLIASKTTEAPLWIAEEDADGNETWLPGTAAHPLAALLEQPNPDQEMSDLIETVVLYYLMGHTLLVLNRDRGERVASVYAFADDQFVVEPAVVDGVPRLYGKFMVGGTIDGRQRTLGPEEVIYLRPPGGVSAVDAALSSIQLGAELRGAVKSSLRKAMRPGSVTTVNGGLQPDQFERLKTQLTAYYGGGQNTGNNLVLDGPDLKWQAVPVNLKDLDLGPLDDATETAICQAFHVPPEIVRAHVALKHNGGLADAIKPAQALYYDQAQFPLWNKLERAFTRGLLRPVDPNPLHFVRFVKDDVRALAPDLTANVNVAKAADGIATLNERRAMISLQPVDGPEGEEISRPPTTGTAPAPDLAKRARVAGETKALRTPNTPDEAKAYWEAFDAKAARRRGDYEATARRLFREERTSVLATLRASVPKALPVTRETKDDPGLSDPSLDERLRAAWEGPYIEAAALQIAADYAENGPYAQAWADEFGALLRATMLDAAEEFLAGVGVTFSMDNPAVIAAIEARAAEMVRHVTETTKQAITDAIASGRAEGLTIEQIAARVDEQAFGAMARARAQTIANTEVVGAINEAEWIAAHDAGVFRSKRWIHSRGAHGRKHHIGFESEGPHGGWVPMGHQYVGLKGATFGRPHEPGMPAAEVVNCDCVLAYSDVDPAQAQEESA